jgi:hypothetical protein
MIFLSSKPNSNQTKPMAEQVRGFKCECCGDYHVADEPPKQEIVDLFKCEVCESVYNDKEDAEGCCEA